MAALYQAVSADPQMTNANRSGSVSLISIARVRVLRIYRYFLYVTLSFCHNGFFVFFCPFCTVRYIRLVFQSCRYQCCTVLIFT